MEFILNSDPKSGRLSASQVGLLTLGSFKRCWPPVSDADAAAACVGVPLRLACAMRPACDSPSITISDPFTRIWRISCARWAFLMLCLMAAVQISPARQTRAYPEPTGPREQGFVERYKDTFGFIR